MTDKIVTTKTPKVGKPVGTAKPAGSGRQKGTPNKNKQEVLDLILATGCRHPIEGLAYIAEQALKWHQVKAKVEIDGNIVEKSVTYPPDYGLAKSCYSDMAQYVVPKKKAVDVTSNGETLTQVESITRVIVDPSHPSGKAVPK